jgi:hypothetical protein
VRQEQVRLLQALFIIIASCAVMYIHLFVPGPGNGADFVDFYAGAYAETHHLDPFVDAQLWQAEKVLFYGGARYHGPEEIYTYKNPPPFAFLIQPLTRWSMGTAYWVWIGLMLLANVLGAWLFLTGWPARARLLGMFAVSCGAAALWGYRVGQVSPLLGLALGLAVWALARSRPGLAGFALALGFMKPHLLLAIALVYVLTVRSELRARVLAGLVSGILTLVAVTLAFDGGPARILHWVAGLRSDSTLFAGQEDVAALPGLVFRVLPGRYDGVVVLLSIACAAAFVGYFFISTRVSQPSLFLCGSIAACYSFLPYVHTSDQVVLALLVVLLAGMDGAGLLDWPIRVAAFTCCLAPLELFHDYRAPVFDMLSPVSVLVACLILSSRRPSPVLYTPD